MSSDFEIGRVVAVDTAQVTVELSPELKALTRATYEGAQEVGRINSYVIIPVGARRLVAMVTRVVLLQDAEITADRTMVTLPSARRVLKATLIGTIDGRRFTQGVSLFPVLDTPVYLVGSEDLDVIFDRAPRTSADGDSFSIPLGEAAVFEGFPVNVDPDRLFGKHAAVLGSTGSGKSCTIASLIQSIVADPKVRRTNIVILDTNGEYAAAFPPGKAKALCIPSSLDRPADRLVVPYWFLNADDFVRLFRAAPTIQRPVLLDGVRRARERSQGAPAWRRVRADISLNLNRMLSAARDTDKGAPRTVRKLAEGLASYLGRAEQAAARAELTTHYPAATEEALRGAIQQVSDVSREGIKDEGGKYESYSPIDADKLARIEGVIEPLLRSLSSTPAGGQGAAGFASADSPIWFDRREFRDIHLSQAMDAEESGRARDHCATLLLRVFRLFEDSRFEFLFGPVAGQWPFPEHSLASFLRDLLGLPSAQAPTPPLSSEDVVPAAALPFYDRQRVAGDGHNVIILDLSLLATEVLENVTALVGRLILEFLQRLGETGEAARGSLPVVLVLEEAQNYIREGRFQEEDSISRLVFERIAREGRKFGLGLVVASQRPSELSKTVLSQCSSFIVHRLQNPEDLRYFKEVVPAVYGALLDQLPVLAPQTALVLGDCVKAPALVHIKTAQPLPRSRDPRFYDSWTREQASTPDVEAICRKWEGKTGPES